MDADLTTSNLPGVANLSIDVSDNVAAGGESDAFVVAELTENEDSD